MSHPKFIGVTHDLFMYLLELAGKGIREVPVFIRRWAEIPRWCGAGIKPAANEERSNRDAPGNP